MYSQHDVIAFLVSDLKADDFKFVCDSERETETTDIELPATAKATIKHFYPGDGRELTIYDTADPSNILVRVNSSNFNSSADDRKYYDAEITYDV